MTRRNDDPFDFFGLIFGWLFALVAVSVFLEIAIAFIVPLLPWIGGVIVTSALIRLWLHRTHRW